MHADLRRAYRLEYLTIGWNGVEAVLSITLGVLAGSVALTAFGLDSVIEVFAAVVVLIELRSHHEHAESRAEQVFVRLIGASFVLLAFYVTVEALYDLLGKARPSESIPGIVVTAASLATMWLLAAAKHREGHRIKSMPLIADSRETRLCSILSAVTLAGLSLNAAFGWWWADPLAAFGIGGFALAEAYETITGQHPEHH